MMFPNTHSNVPASNCAAPISIFMTWKALSIRSSLTECVIEVYRDWLTIGIIMAVLPKIVKWSLKWSNPNRRNLTNVIYAQCTIVTSVQKSTTPPWLAKSINIQKILRIQIRCLRKWESKNVETAVSQWKRIKVVIIWHVRNANPIGVGIVKRHSRHRNNVVTILSNNMEVFSIEAMSMMLFHKNSKTIDSKTCWDKWWMCNPEEYDSIIYK